jgi:aminopeptidase N
MRYMLVRLLTGAVMALLGVASVFAAPDLVLDVNLDPQTRQFKASAELRASAGNFRFLLHESLRVTEATAGGQSARIDQSGGPAGYRQWTIAGLRVGQSLVVHYAGQLPPLERNRDHRSVLGGMPPMAAPEGSFLASGSGWYPRPADLFSYRANLSVPNGQRALVAGNRIAETLPAGPKENYQATFEFAQPADGIDLMAGPWIVREKAVVRPGQPPLFLRTFFPADLDAQPGLAQAYLDDTQGYIERYSREIGPYPYSEFSIVASPLPTGFGMPTLTYLGADVLRLPFIRKTSLGHEILHNWWGNGVYVDYERGNWSEGLTTFMADYAYKEEESPGAASDMRLAWLRDAAVFAGENPGSLRDFRSRANAAGATVGYGKAAMVFVMLRDRLGKKAFEQGIRNFWAAQRFKVAGWEDLQAAFEKASGEKLGSFFNAWLDQEALPDLAIARADSIPSGKQHQLNLRFTKQAAQLPLRLPLEVSGGGKRETHWVDLPAESTTASIKLGFQPQTVRLDPEMRLWRRLEASQLPPILRQWMAARSPQLINAASASEANFAVDQLAGRFFEAKPRLLSPAQLSSALKGKQPVLLVGTHGEIDQLLARAGLPARPANLAGQGTAQVWTVPDIAAPLAIISGRDAAALNALQRGLPHYGGQSWLVFNQGRAINKGIWPSRVPEIRVVNTLPKA